MKNEIWKGEVGEEIRPLENTLEENAKKFGITSAELFERMKKSVEKMKASPPPKEYLVTHVNHRTKTITIGKTK